MVGSRAVGDGGTLVSVSGDLGVDWQAGLGRAPRSSDSVQRRRRRAEALATELCRLRPAQWRRHAAGAAQSRVSYVGDDPALADILAEAWDLARSRPGAGLVRSQRGDAGVVVVAHAQAWSLVARSGGPVLVLSTAFDGVVRLEPDAERLPEVELSTLTAELINLSRGLPPFDDSVVPPAPPLGWHRPG